jgi:hypothetical protein
MGVRLGNEQRLRLAIDAASGRMWVQLCRTGRQALGSRVLAGGGATGW